MLIKFNPFLVYKCCIFYLVIPIIFFFMGWLRFGVGLILSFLLVAASFCFLTKVKELVSDREKIVLNKEFYVSFLILFLFLLSTGNTGFVGSWGVDIPWRNAIYQDLIRQSWPVIYDYSQSMLCYYMTFWLVPAAITSCFHLNEFGSNVVLFLWMYVGLILIFFLLYDLLKPKEGLVVLITILFLFFSGINTFGMILKSFLLEPSLLITNYPARGSWSFSDYSNVSGVDIVLIIRSTYLCISDVYNQFFAIAISTFLFLKFRNYPGFYAFVGLLSLPYSPIGFIGIFLIILLYFLINAFKNKQIKEKVCFFKNSISIPNILASLSIVPIFYFYFTMNIHASNLLSADLLDRGGYFTIPFDKVLDPTIFSILLLYYYFYFMTYVYLIYKNYKTECLFWIILLCLLVFPFFKIGSTADFNFNASICPYLILFFFIAKYLLNAIDTNHFGMKELVLVFCLSIAMLTPITQITSALRAAYLNDVVCYRWSPWNSQLAQDSFRDKDIRAFRNFLAQNYQDELFYSFCAKRNTD